MNDARTADTAPRPPGWVKEFPAVTFGSIENGRSVVRVWSTETLKVRAG
jgi:hypothetical protein